MKPEWLVVQEVGSIVAEWPLWGGECSAAAWSGSLTGKSVVGWIAAKGLPPKQAKQAAWAWVCKTFAPLLGFPEEWEPDDPWFIGCLIKGVLGDSGWQKEFLPLLAEYNTAHLTPWQTTGCPPLPYVQNGSYIFPAEINIMEAI